MDSTIKDRLRSLSAHSAEAPFKPSTVGVPKPVKGKEPEEGSSAKSLQIAPLTEKGKAPVTMDLTLSRKRSQSETELGAPPGKISEDLTAFMKKAMTLLKPELREAKAKADIDALSNTCMAESLNVRSMPLSPFSCSLMFH